MSGFPYLARTLAKAFLAGAWTVEGLIERGTQALPGRRKLKWLPGLAAAIVPQFAGCVPVPVWRTVAQFITSYRELRKVPFGRGAWPKGSLQSLPTQSMSPAPALQGKIDVPVLEHSRQLADWLEVPLRQLDWYADCLGDERTTAEGPLRHYRCHLLTKRSGQVRIVEAPKARLKRMQRKILQQILDPLPPHPAAHAFRSGHSVATYVAPHTGREVVLHLDLQNFFPSVQASRVNAVFRTIGYPEQVARLLTGLCTTTTPNDVLRTALPPDGDWSAWLCYGQPHLPQGAPTSPALANLCARRLDVRLHGLARRFQASYTRYADDLLFSGDAAFSRDLQRFRILACALILAEGFSIRSRKTRVLRQSQSQRVAGVVLNAHPNPPREDYEALKALLFNCGRFGPASQNRAGHPHFREHLQGRIAYLGMINETRAAKLRLLFDRIDWDLQTPCPDAKEPRTQ